LLFITTWDDCPSQNPPTDSAEEAPKLQDILAEQEEVERSALYEEPELNELTVSEETVTRS
jgi:hypothetical protein